MRTSGPQANLYLRRFGTNYTVAAGTLTPGKWLALRAPLGSAPDPWYATSKSGPLSICAPGGA